MISSALYCRWCWRQLLKRNEVTHDGYVSYDYSYKQWSERDVGDVTADRSGQYRWSTTTWSSCNATCGTGSCANCPFYPRDAVLSRY